MQYKSVTNEIALSFDKDQKKKILFFHFYCFFIN
jgi:hypothetical protein